MFLRRTVGPATVATIVVPTSGPSVDAYGSFEFNPDVITFKVEFETIKDYHRYIKIVGTNGHHPTDDEEDQSTSYKFII